MQIIFPPKNTAPDCLIGHLQTLAVENVIFVIFKQYLCFTPTPSWSCNLLWPPKREVNQHEWCMFSAAPYPPTVWPSNYWLLLPAPDFRWCLILVRYPPSHPTHPMTSPQAKINPRALKNGVACQNVTTFPRSSTYLPPSPWQRPSFGIAREEGRILH